jgi:hypothetical protein
MLELDNFYGEGKTPTLVTDREAIGDFVGRIIKDERTLNQYVVIHEEEVTQEQIWKIAEETSPEGAEIFARKRLVCISKPRSCKATLTCFQISYEDHMKRIETMRETYTQNPSEQNRVMLGIVEYMHSIYFRGDNTLVGAKKLNALIAQELYPDVKTKTLLEYAKNFYAAPKNIF